MRILLRAGRVLSLVLLSVIGTSVLMYLAPGYFTDASELDAAHASAARMQLGQMAREQTSMVTLLRSELRAWTHGDLGSSRQFGTPVAELIEERASRSGRLLVSGVLAGWSFALLLAFPLSLRDGPAFDLTVGVFTSFLLALPVGVLATLCLLGNVGGPVLVLATMVAARDFKVLHRMLGSAWNAPYVLHAHASGLPWFRIFTNHLLPNMKSELLALAVMSFTLALSALVPVEVIFDIPGLGHLAWSAAMNRDLPVLVAITALMSACVGLAGSITDGSRALEDASCA